MKLTELHARWVGAGGEGIRNADGSPVPERHGVGVMFDCPTGCDVPQYIPFANPLDGGPPADPDHVNWQRTGETIGTLTLSPSILRHPVGDVCPGWHGWVRNGETVNA